MTWELTSQLAKIFVTNLEKMHAELKQAIVEAQRCYQGPVDAWQAKAPIFQLEDMAYVLAKFIRTTQLSKKLLERYLGPFPVTKQVGFYSYLMKLPEHL